MYVAVKEVSEQSQELLRQALEEAQAELSRKFELIRQIRAIESVPYLSQKFVDDTEVLNILCTIQWHCCRKIMAPRSRTANNLLSLCQYRQEVMSCFVRCLWRNYGNAWPGWRKRSSKSRKKEGKGYWRRNRTENSYWSSSWTPLLHAGLQQDRPLHKSNQSSPEMQEKHLLRKGNEFTKCQWVGFCVKQTGGEETETEVTGGGQHGWKSGGPAEDSGDETAGETEEERNWKSQIKVKWTDGCSKH